MNRIFDLFMRKGAKILFWIAVLGFVISMLSQLLLLFSSLQQMASHHNSDAVPYINWENFVASLASSFLVFGLLYFGSLIINRFDSLLELKRAAE